MTWTYHLSSAGCTLPWLAANSAANPIEYGVVEETAENEILFDRLARAQRTAHSTHCATEYSGELGVSLPQLATGVYVARTSNCSSTRYHAPLANLEIMSVPFRVLLVIVLRLRPPVNVQTCPKMIHLHVSHASCLSVENVNVVQALSWLPLCDRGGLTHREEFQEVPWRRLFIVAASTKKNL